MKMHLMERFYGHRNIPKEMNLQYCPMIYMHYYLQHKLPLPSPHLTKLLCYIPDSHQNEQTDSSTVSVQFTNGELREVPRMTVAVQKGRSPIDAWPDAFIFFDRCSLAPTSHPFHSYVLH